MRSSACTALPLGLSILAFASRASADEPPAAAPPAAPPSDDAALTGDVGAFAGGDSVGVLAGATLLVHDGLLAGGARGQAAAALFDSSTLSASALGGVSFQPGRRWRVDALGEAGVNAYSGAGRGLFAGDDPGASATLPFVGGRVGATHAWDRFVLGFFVAASDDVARKSVAYSYYGRGPGLLSGDPSPHGETVRIGYARASMGVTLGGRFEL